MSKAERAARIAELTPRFLERINREGLSTDPERRQRQERIIELLEIAKRRRDAALAGREVTNESL